MHRFRNTSVNHSHELVKAIAIHQIMNSGNVALIREVGDERHVLGTTFLIKGARGYFYRKYLRFVHEPTGGARILS